MDIYDFLAHLNIAYERHDHPAVFTVEEADVYAEAIVGTHTKNLFLRDKKGKRHFLVVAGSHTSVNLKELSKTLNVSNLSFASPERLMKHLGIEPGSVSSLALFTDREAHNVEVVFEQAVWESDFICCHPLVNTVTLVIAKADLERFLDATGHDVTILPFSSNKR